ncbi:MAG: ATP-dependent helicase [Prevotella sp.]|jgi:DNA helicase-2/ATP-dependent DNA helicase PcrA
MDLRKELNDSQLAAVEYVDGPQLVVAGAGSGKTRVLTYKIAYLLEMGLMPWTILALTFTNKAAKEMRERIISLVGGDKARGLQMGTFHSVFSHILRVEASSIGYRSSFTIYDETDSRSLLKNIVKEMGLSDKIYSPSAVHNKISRAKNRLVFPEQYSSDSRLVDGDVCDGMGEVSIIYTTYQQRLQQASAMDFDDLLMLTWKLFREHDDIRQKYAKRFQYVLVDEYQDTNYVQQRIVYQLTAERQKLCVVGDDYQSIYAFRGANIDNILNFQSDYPKAKLFKLERNYRSTQNIVAAANSLMKHNEHQIPKNVYSENAAGDRITYKQLHTDKEEAAYVCKNILHFHHVEGCDYGDFAILYRTNSQSRTFEDEMRKQNIPYRIFGGMSFYQRKEIKDVLAYFRLIVNHDDEEAFRRIINYPTRGIGATTLNKVIACAGASQTSLWNVIDQPQLYGLDVSASVLNKLTAFRDLIVGFSNMIFQKDAYDLGRLVISHSGISADIAKDHDDEAVARQENIDQFVGGLSDFAETQREEGEEEHVFLPDFLQTVSLLTDLDSDDNSQSRVSLMTMHAAKGLEFPTVFVVGLEQNIIPSGMSAESKKGIEEERRLLYVAITRAEKRCFLTSAKSRWRYGKMEFSIPSSFLLDISSDYLAGDNPFQSSRSRFFGDGDFEIDRPYRGFQDYGNGPRLSRRMQNSEPVADRFIADPKPKITRPHQPEQAADPLSERTKQRLLSEGGNAKKLAGAIANGGRLSSSFKSVRALNRMGVANNRPDNLASQLTVGCRILHTRFGEGRVVALDGQGENLKATVEFDNVGMKQLLVKFAKFNIIK